MRGSTMYYQEVLAMLKKIVNSNSIDERVRAIYEAKRLLEKLGEID